jgi:5'-3' exoribonuclease 1
MLLSICLLPWLQRDLGIKGSVKEYFKEEDKDRDTLLEADFSKFKAKYYQEKMGFTNVNRGVLEEQAKCYVVGIQWILHYYYSGVPS